MILARLNEQFFCTTFHIQKNVFYLSHLLVSETIMSVDLDHVKIELNRLLFNKGKNALLVPIF